MSLVPPNYLDAVAVVEEARQAEDAQKFAPIATGTIIGYEAPDQSEAEKDETMFAVFLVTNRHVIEGRSELWLRFNQGAGSKRFRIAVTDEDGNDQFFISKKFDVAAVGLNAVALRDAGAEFDVIPERALLDLTGLEEAKVTGGESIFVLGFPMGITGTQRKYAIVRGGVVARVDRDIVEETGGFLIDCPVFPGNSGGPVVLKPEAFILEGTPARDRTHVIGIVSSYLPYIETAVSEQTGRPRVSFEENSGLASVVPLEVVAELVEPHMAALREQHQLELSDKSPDPERPNDVSLEAHKDQGVFGSE
jgi:Trypsin-like peptidase domain